MLNQPVYYCKYVYVYGKVHELGVCLTINNIMDHESRTYDILLNLNNAVNSTTARHMLSATTLPCGKKKKKCPRFNVPTLRRMIQIQLPKSCTADSGGLLSVCLKLCSFLFCKKTRAQQPSPRQPYKTHRMYSTLQYTC